MLCFNSHPGVTCIAQLFYGFPKRLGLLLADAVKKSVRARLDPRLGKTGLVALGFPAVGHFLPLAGRQVGRRVYAI